jgi:hypothetical protein
MQSVTRSGDAHRRLWGASSSLMTARRWLVFLSAAVAAVLAAVLAVVLPVTMSSASGVSAAGTHVGASQPRMILAVGVWLGVRPVQGRCDSLPQHQFAVAACVAPEDSAGATCGGMSFAAATGVLLAAGKTAAISKLHKGDEVIATNTKTGKTTAQTVAAVLVHHDTNRYDLRVQTAQGTAVVQTTSSHLFWDADSHRWIKAAALRYGTHLRTPGSGTATALSGWTPRDSSGWMWDLTIPGDHDFYIQAGTANVLVHNCGEDGESSSIDSGNYRGRFNAQLASDGKPRLPDDWDAHHVIPQMYRDQPEFQDFDFDAPSNIAGVPGNRAGLGVGNIHNQVTQMWADFAEANSNASRSMIEGFATRVRATFEGYWWRP